ncbi:hypothetical protein SAMN06295910_2456 [Allosphingosinicella indica]|uniref:Uncharacterized protein n=1 Tax=Allosphingosinicella indica TaxID=941907 RepID=A0A1X7GXU8_9SPHN|nr:hypothetical protein SAMN06295910_2456 [Allosphingosinicella indica]
MGILLSGLLFSTLFAVALLMTAALLRQGANAILLALAGEWLPQRRVRIRRIQVSPRASRPAGLPLVSAQPLRAAA